MADSSDLSSHTLTVKAETAIDQFYSRVGEIIRGWTKIFTIKTDQREITNYNPVDVRGVTAFTAQAGTGDIPAADDMTYGGGSYTAPAYEKRLTVTEYQIAKTPSLMTDIANEVADAAENTISTLCFTLLASVATTAHPDTSYTEDGAGTVYLADNFATPVDQDNITTSALSATSLAAAHKMLRLYKNKSGRVMDFASDPLALVIHGALEQTARDLKGQSIVTYDGSGTTSVVNSLFQEVIVNPHATDTNDWMLVSMRRNPFGLWMPRMPFFRAMVQPGAGRVEIYAGYEAGTFLKPFEGGFIWNAVT